MNQWLSESRIQWTIESANARVNLWANAWIFMNRWLSEWASLRIPEDQWIANSLNQSMNDPLDQSIGESQKELWANEQRDGWMNERMDRRAAFVWSTGPFRWGTPSLSYFFSEQPLVWATCALSCLPACSFLVSATQVFSSCSCYKACSLPAAIPAKHKSITMGHAFRAAVAMKLATSSCNPACQEHRSITHALLRRAVPMRFATAGCKPVWQEHGTK